MFSLNDMLKRFADNYDKNPTSNIGKLIGILYDQFKQADDTLETVRSWRGIDAARGGTLDRIGENIVQSRGVATDEVYRVLIKSKIARNLSKGDINTIIHVLALALDCSYSEIKIKELYTESVSPEPCGISLIQVPIKRLNEVGMDAYQFAKIVQKTVAAGVTVQSIQLEGTFQFADGSVPQDDTNAGLSDVNQTVGGYFGAVYSPGQVVDLPI